MYYAKPKNVKLPFDSSDEEDKGSGEEKDEETSPPERLKPLEISPASALATSGPNRLRDNVPGVSLDGPTVPKLFPVVPKVSTAPATAVATVAEWQKQVDERRKKLKENPVYQFAHLVAGHMERQSIDSLLEPTLDFPGTTDENDKKSIAKTSSLAQNVIATGQLNFSPTFTAALDAAYTDVVNWINPPRDKPYRGNDAFKRVSISYAQHLIGSKRKNVPSLEELMTTPGPLQSQFARLVSRIALANGILARNGYHLQVDYDRVMMERDALLRSIKMLINGSKN